MGTNRTLYAIAAVAALLPAILVMARRSLSLRVVEVLHVVGAALLVGYAAAAIRSLSFGSTLLVFRGRGDDGSELLPFLLMAGATVAGLVAWWALNARPRSVAAGTGADDGGLDEDDPDEDGGYPRRETPVVPAVLFLGLGIALISVYPMTSLQYIDRIGRGVNPEMVLLMVVNGVVLGLPLLAAVLGDDDAPDWPAYVAFGLVSLAMLFQAVVAAESMDLGLRDDEWFGPLVLGLSLGLVAPAALDVLGDLTSAVRPYAIPVGIVAAAALLSVAPWIAVRAGTSMSASYGAGAVCRTVAGRCQPAG